MQTRFRSVLGFLCLLLAAFHAPAAVSKEVTRADFIEITYQTLLKYEAEFKSSGYIRVVVKMPESLIPKVYHFWDTERQVSDLKCTCQVSETS